MRYKVPHFTSYNLFRPALEGRGWGCGREWRWAEWHPRLSVAAPPEPIWTGGVRILGLACPIHQDGDGSTQSRNGTGKGLEKH